ncbi:transposase [Deinococcus sp. UYEF24]
MSYTSALHTCKIRGEDDRTTFEALQTARERVYQAEFRLIYKDRAGIESTMSQGVRRFGIRVARYRGKAKVALQESFAATAMNVEHATQWLSGSRPAGTYRTQFARPHPSS